MARIQDLVVATISVHSIIPLIVHPESLIYVGGKSCGAGLKLFSLFLLAECGSHL